MRARIALAILGTAVGALLLAGAATFVVLRLSARAEAEDQVREQTQVLADALAPVDGRRPEGFRSAAFSRLAEGLDVAELAVILVTPSDRLRGDLPEPIRESDVLAARDGAASVSGRRAGEVWAATPVEGRFRGAAIAGDTGIGGDEGGDEGGSGPGASGAVVGTAVVVATDPDTPPTPPVLGVFAWVALGTVIVGAGVALALARGLTGPLRRAEGATGRIAAGDLSARVPEPTPRSPTEIADLSRSINLMAATLERSRGVERQFLLSVSHDLRTPLTSVRGWAEAIRDGTAPDAVRAAQIIETEARRLDRLVGDLLELGRLESGQFSLVPVEVEVARVIADVVAGAQPDADAADLTLHLDDRSAAGRAVVDPDRLGQVVANLVDNAAKFAVRRVGVAVEATPGRVVITVSDDGPGIAAEDLPHVFERLYVSRHRPTRRESGSGLGLAIVRELVAAMGGTVAALSPVTPLGGTAVRVELPSA